MKIKLILAVALFVSSVSFEQQVLQTKNGLDNSWSVSIHTTNSAFARYAEMQMNAF